VADNVTLNPGSGGVTIATDDDGTRHWPYTKLAYGADDTQTIVSSTDALPVQGTFGVASAPVVEAQSSLALASGSSATLDFAAIPVGQTGKLMSVSVCSTLPGKWVVSSRDGGSAITKLVLITQAMETILFRAADKDSVVQAYVSGDENFRVVVTNLDNARAADYYVTLEWDEE
jgi:hypothetical protein